MSTLRFPLKVGIADADLKNLQLLQLFLEIHFPDMSTILICDSFDALQQALSQQEVDLIFLDAKLSSTNTPKLIQSLRVFNPQVVFLYTQPEEVATTFDFPVIDTVKKPLTIATLNKVIKKAQMRILEKEIHTEHQKEQEGKELTDSILPVIEPFSDVLTVPLIKGKTLVINVSDIIRCESSGDLSTVHFNNKKSNNKQVTTKSLRDYEKELPADHFFRSHKQHIVNLSYVDKLQLRPSLLLELKNGEKVQLGRRRKQAFIDAFRRFKSEISL